MQKAGLMAAAVAARRIQAAVLGASTAAAQRTRTTLFESSSTAMGSRSLMSRDLLRRLPHQEVGTIFELPHAAYFRLHWRPVSASASSPNKNVAVGNKIAFTEQLRKFQSESTTQSPTDYGSLKDIEYRILTLETVCNSYQKFQWLLLGPIVVGLLMTVPATINVVYGVSEVKQRQKKTAEELNNLNKRIKYLEEKTT